MNKSSVLSAFVLSFAAQLAAAQQQPPIRQLGSVVAKSKETFAGQNVWVRALRNGTVLVNDIFNRRVVLLDSSLSLTKTVADTTSATANAYSGRSGSLIAFRGDSTLFVDPQSLTMLVIDAEGNVGRTMALPRSQDAMMLGNPMIGGATFDGHGRIVYRAAPRLEIMRGAGERGAAGRAPGGAGAGGGPPMAPEFPDSTPIVRVDLVSRAVDTVGFIRIPKIKMDVTRDDNGRVTMTSQMNPLPTVDDFAVLSDGSVALIRGRDYHVDWMRADGARESSAKIPFDWRRLTDEDKVAFIDSVKAQRERMANAPTLAAPGAPGAVAGGMAGGVAGGEVRIMMGGPGGGPPGAGAGPGRMNMNFVPASELPDYQPVFFAGSARADADGQVWVRTIPTKALPGGPVYDVINAKGELVDRVQVPKDRLIVGFGAGGVVYLAAREGNAQTIERAKSK